MKKHILVLLLALCSMLLACGSGQPEETGNYSRFDYNMRGTWTSNDPSRYSGSLTFTYDRITITGYGENQTPVQGGNDEQRPFRNITKNIALKGYSEEGHIFIEDGGLVQEGIPYIYWSDMPPPDFKRVDFLRFTFGDRHETLQKEAE
jgi:hypothetical protein